MLTKGIFYMNRLLFILFALLAGTMHATTWQPSKLTDPINGKRVSSWALASYGSYVYRYPSKYDLVFIPFTHPNYLTFNPKTGYGAFNNDFEELSGQEKKTVRKWLSENYRADKAPSGYLAELEWVEKIYGQRKMGDDFWDSFYRLMAYEHKNDKPKQLKYVRKAMPLLQKKLKTNPEGIVRTEVIYLLGEYHRRCGELDEARKYFGQVKTAKYKDWKGKEHAGHLYLLELVQDREKLLEIPEKN